MFLNLEEREEKNRYMFGGKHVSIRFVGYSSSTAAGWGDLHAGNPTQATRDHGARRTQRVTEMLLVDREVRSGAWWLVRGCHLDRTGGRDPRTSVCRSEPGHGLAELAVSHKRAAA